MRKSLSRPEMKPPRGLSSWPRRPMRRLVMAKSRSARLPGRLDVADFWPRMVAAARCVSEELDRSRAAERHYDALRTGRAAAFPPGGRGGKARQVFTEIYARPPV